MKIGIVLCMLLGVVVMAEAMRRTVCPIPKSPVLAYDNDGTLLNSRSKIDPSIYGTPIFVKCPKGYDLLGSKKYICYDYGWFPWREAQCVKRTSCDRRMAPNKGYVSPRPNVGRKYKIGTIIQFSCEDGYRLEGKEKDRCGKDGEWIIDDTPECVLIKCPYRAPPANGFVNPNKKQYFYNNIITFSCKKPKYVLVGKPKDKCGKYDEWLINDTPECKITCQGRSAPGNGTVQPKRDYFFANQNVVFECNKGFRLEGNPEDVCKPNGNWKINDTPKCVLITCPQRMAPDNGRILGVSDLYLPKNKIKFECEEGYRLIGEEYDTCQRDGSWEVNKTPTCELIPCRQRKAPRNGKIVGAKGKYVPDDMITFECDGGYRLEGEDEDTCLLGGSWDVNKTPECILIICRQRKAPANGNILGAKDPYVPDDSITFECDKYYALDGEEQDTCQDDGSWEIDDTPKCVQITCPQRMAPANGAIKGVRDPYVPENKIKFSCDKYYRLEGEEQDTCLGDGSWDVNTTPTCVQITCPQRMAPENGQLLGSKDPYVPTDMITFKCDDEYRLEGEEKDRCEEDGDGSWRINRTPKCVLILCKKYDAPKNGAYKLFPLPGKKPLQPGTKLRFFCLDGYELEGYPFDKCVEGGVWKFKKLPICKSLPCDYRNAPAHGYIQGKNTKYVVGDKITFTCKTGYATEIKYDECQEKGLWKYADAGKYPSCVTVPGY